MLRIKNKNKKSIFFFQVKITTFRHIHFYLSFNFSSVTTLIVKKLLQINVFTNISIKVDIHITVTNKLDNKTKQYCYENR